MSFAKADELTTLAQARDAFNELLAAHQGALAEKAAQAEALEKVREEARALREDLAAANEMLDEASRDKTALSEQVGQLTGELDDAKGAITAKGDELARSLEQVAGLQSRIGELEAQAKSAEAKAAEICASVGVEPAQIAPGGEPRQQSLLEQMRAIRNPAEQMAFFRKHKEAILRGQ